MTSIRITCNRSPTINLVSVTVETSLTEYTTTIGVQSSSLKLFQDALLTRAMVRNTLIAEAVLLIRSYAAFMPGTFSNNTQSSTPRSWGF